MARLLVTGGAGFIGANFVRWWRDRHPDDAITVVDALTYAGNRRNLDAIDRVDFVHADIRDHDRLVATLADQRIDVIVHFAAETHVDRSIAAPDAFVDTNVAGTHSLLRAARQVWLDAGSGQPHRFHHISTDEVYGSLARADPPATEDRSYAPNSPYAASKAGADHLVRAYAQTYGLETTITHCSNNYGPRQLPEKLIPRFLINALQGRDLPIYGDGLNLRDWLHVEDHCRGVALAIGRGRPGERYNLGGGAALANLAVADMLCAAIDAAFAADPALARRFPDAPAARGRPTAALKRFVADRPGHDRRYAIDDSKARAKLGYAPETDFAAGFAATLRWYLDNQDWWRPSR